MTLKIQHPSSIQINGVDLPTTEEFTYLGSTIRNDGGTSNDITSWLNKARNTFRMLNNVVFWFSHVSWGEVWGMFVFSLFAEAGLGSSGGM